MGDPLNCIALGHIRGSAGLDDRTIDFTLRDGRVMRNRLRNDCPGLAFEERFQYRASIDRLCSTDAITVVSSYGMRGPTCALGTFQPVEIPRR